MCAVRAAVMLGALAVAACGGPDIVFVDAAMGDAAADDATADDAAGADAATADAADTDAATADAADPDAALDAAVPDAAVPDAAVPDAALDAAMLDATVPDAAMTDAPMLDAALADAAMTDAAMTDAAAIDATVVDAAAPACAPSAAGFAAAAAAFPLPSYPNGVWAAEYNGSCSTGDTRFFTLRDMDGDDRPDLVITNRCFDATVGKTEWIIHRNLGTGFDPTGTSYPLPSYPNGIWAAEYNGSCSTGDTRFFTLRDMDADNRPDLVITNRCFDATVGKTEWTIHRNTPTGFAAGTSYPLPSYTNGIWAAEYNGSCSTGETRFFTLRDMDADSRPDLVITNRCFDATIGKTEWTIHRNTPTGFAAGTSYPLPSYTNGIWAAEYNGSCSTGETRFFTLRDMDADGRPDLVITNRCFDAAVGKTQWVLHRNTATGFAPGTCFALPSYPNGIWAAEYNGSCSTGDTRFFTLRDLSADGRPDLVVTNRCFDATVGKTEWHLHTSAGL